MGYDAPPRPLGPDSLTWKIFGDWRGLLQGPWAGSMQNMHPQLGAAVKEHSIFFTERILRLFRSLYPTLACVDGDRAPTTGAEVRGLPHSDQGGRRAGPALQRPEPRRLLLGARDVLHGHDPDRRAFRRRFDRGTETPTVRRARHLVPDVRHEHAAGAEDAGGIRCLLGSMCWRNSENTWAAREVLNLSTMPKPLNAQWIPDRLWSVYLRLMEPFAVWVTVGLYDEPVRELMGYTWSARDAWLHRRFGRAVNLAFKALPRRRRMHPRARAGWDRAEGRIPFRRSAAAHAGAQPAAYCGARQGRSLRGRCVSRPDRADGLGRAGRSHSARCKTASTSAPGSSSRV